MSNLLDIRTLILVITLVLLCRALILGYVWTITRQYPPVKLWMIGSAMVAIGALLLALRGVIPDMLSVFLANIALISGWMIISFGTLMAAEHPVPWRAGVLVLVAAAAGCFWFLSITPDLARRTVVTSVPPIIFDTYVGMACLAYKGTYRRTTLRVLATLLLLSAAANGLKAYHVYSTNSQNMFVAGWEVLPFYITALVTSVMGTVIYVLLAVHHVQEQLDHELMQHKQHEETLKIAAMFFESTSEGMIITDAHGTITAVNPAFTGLSGYTAEEAIGKTPRLLKSDKQDAEFYKRMWNDILSKGEWKGEMWNRHKNGNLVSEEVVINTVHGANGSVQRRIALYHDITQQKKSAEAVFHQANYDALTELANRHLFFQQLAQELSRARRAGHRVGLLFMDLNKFKPVNDQFGHEAGDFVLKTVAHRWQTCVRAGDTLARVGGDEFALIVRDLSLTTEVEQIAHKLIHAVAEPIELPDGNRCEIGVSVGISIYPDNAAEMDSLIAAADAAMYESKHSGRRKPVLSQAESRPNTLSGNWLVFEAAHLTGVKIIDDQHRQMVQMVNDLNRFIAEGRDDAGLQNLFSELLAFTGTHFATEEMLMAHYGYPGVEEHKRQHVSLLSDLQDIAGQFNQGAELRLLQSIKDWLLGHIQHADKPLGAYLIARDVSPTFIFSKTLLFER
jgi:diguanylate cyclase (GGDEF)-like protein/hemerythrin-like metal-binding protein/PAS domain S-box-containing protein